MVTYTYVYIKIIITCPLGTFYAYVFLVSRLSRLETLAIRAHYSTCHHDVEKPWSNFDILISQNISPCIIKDKDNMRI